MPTFHATRQESPAVAVKKVKRRGRWMWRARVKGTDGREYTAWRARKDEADQAELDLIKSLEEASAGQPKKKKEVPTFDKFVDEYMANHAQHHNKPSTLKAKRSLLDNHLLPFFGKLRIDEIGAKEIATFTTEVVGKELHPKTINNALTTLRAMLLVGEEWGYLSELPKVKWLRPPKPEVRWLDFEEAERLVKAAQSEPLAHAMIVMALNTGMRLGELLALRWDNLDLKLRIVHVAESLSAGVVGTPKSGRARDIPLNDTVVEALQKWRHLRGPLVFCKDDGLMMDQHEARYPLRRAQRRAGIRALGWHDLRHTFASHLVMLGEPLKAVQELLGHATIDVTMRYAHLSPRTRETAVHRLDQGRRETRGGSKGGSSAGQVVQKPL